MKNLNAKNLLVIILFLGTFAVSGQTTIWFEDFESPTAVNDLTGTATGPEATSWAATGDTHNNTNRRLDVASVGGSQVMRARNTDQTETWATAIVDISGYTNISFSMDAGLAGVESGDSFTGSYRIDSGTWMNFQNTTTTGVLASYSVTGLSGSTLEIRVQFVTNQNSDTEYYFIDDVTIQGTPVGTSCTTQSTSPNVTIPDNNATGVSRTVNFSTTSTVTDVNVTVDITHPWDSDLTINITSPLGTTVLLSSGNGGNGDDYTNTVFDDAGGTPITSGSAPFTGTFSPEGNLSDFNGENPIGNWTLTVSDNAGSDVGTLNSFSVEVCTAAGSPDLAVSKTVDDSTPGEGSNIVYTLSIVNNGPVDATNVSLTDVLPAGVSYVSDDGSYNSGTGVWTIGTLNNGNTATLNITASVDGGTSGSTITNTITSVTADQTDSNATVDDLSESIVPTVDQPPVLTVTGNQVYCPGTSLAIAETFSLTDPDDTTTDAIFIQISSGYINGEDLLTLTGTHPNITATWDAVEGELTLQGPTTFTEFEAAVLAVEYSSSAVSPTGTRQFSITPGSANFLPPTGHYYEFISSPNITWTAARDAAALRTYFGLQGYLATLTSQAEADFSGSQALGVGWIGGSDAATEGDWRWVTGPEGLANAGAGTPFWSGTAGGTTTAPDFFAFWNAGEPNQSGNEDYAHITDVSVTSSPGSWNDLPNTTSTSGPYQAQGYVVEYGGTTGDPVLSITGVTTITIDNVNPTATNPLPVTVNCSADVPAVAITDVTDEADNCTASPAVTHISDVSDGGTNPEIITRTYRITDDAGNFIDVTQTITVDPISIDIQPTDQTVNLGSNGTFVSSTSNADTYQWQVSTNGGGSFSNITNGVEYSGTTTEVLTVLTPGIAKNGYIYRIIVSNSGGSCTSITSSEATLTIAIDTDGDGIFDNVDLDDDNDGILDAVESPKTVLWVTNGTAGTEEQNTIDKLTALGYTVTVVDDNVGGDANSYGVTFVYEDVFSGDALANVANLSTTERGVITSEPALHDDILGAATGGSSGLTSVNIINNTHPITSGLSLGNYNIGDALYHGNGLTTGTVLGRDPNNSEASIVIWEQGDAMEVGTAPGKRAIVPHANGNGGFNSAGEDLLVNAIIWTAAIDTDNDGVYDDLDLDSDNDGVYDAVEAGHDQAYSSGRLTGAVGTDGVPNSVQASGQENSGTTNYTIANSDSSGNNDYLEADSDADGCGDADEAYADINADSDDNGTYGSGIPAINLDGTVQTAAYTVPADEDTNTIFDFQEAGVAPAITVQPIDSTTCPGCGTTFNVTGTNADTFQWQRFNGLTWDNVNDTGIYSGATTSTLTVTNPTAANDGEQYQALVSNSAYICSFETSNTVTLTIRVSGVITNRRITYRVKRN
ncbi:proprotein convertase P-domain-containing protein [Flagellimonas sp. CMM7]|uniref:proprotein convertase P-domain-containing protein n=1 Tax=Flagellimonas sp. CMM7 TaxID=2654676 RepID=UPI0013D5E32A|nr:proprotein convertase P-domain-containing protein [Flagellimonas sp. CMM7]UII80488.1 proprotein convertase P-domain-containing protein [Flagellimonas sp. CMM7]